MIGQQVDSALFAPKARHGPRLGDLAVQTSSYGTHIPKIFGTMRVAGTVIWSTDLQERRSTSGGGKGRPKSVNYAYSASFAVALSGRPVKTVRRIWADGKLLRGAAGDFKSRTVFRLYKGGEDQAVDPLIASVEGIGNVPAFRGTAYALFENLELADYGNRIPSLTFELVADEAAVAIGSIAEEISQGGIADGGTLLLGGYAASGDSVRGAIEALSDVVPLSLIEDGGRLKIGRAYPGEPLLLREADCGARASGSGGRSEFVRLSAAAVAGEVSLTYHDARRDYQTGMQRATRGSANLRADRRALPAALQADSAKAIAEYRLACLWAARASAKVHLGWRGAALRPGRQVRLEGQVGLWKVERWTLDRMVVTLQLAGSPGVSLEASGASAGRPIGQFDHPAGPTSLLLLDLPSLTDEWADRPRLFAMAAGAGAGWRRAEIGASYDGGMSWSEVGATAGPAIIGKSLSVLAPAGAALIDARHSVEVELLNDSMWLEGRTDAALVVGANLAVLDDELIQFGRVEALGGRRFRLSRLLRGRRGTEWAASLHEVGGAFALIEPESLIVLEPPRAMLGGQAKLLAHGIGDWPEGASAERSIAGEAMRPPSPVHLHGERAAGGDISISWVRRSRSGWAWLSGSDTPLGEESEMYQIELSGAGLQRSISTSEACYVYSAAQQGADGFAGALTVTVVQLGSAASSRPARIII
jgi:hypothetical protein